MPPDMAISMRHTKISAKEAAMLAGEVEKPGWQSKNEGIHERVSFEDAIWGFDLAGGAFYKTPLRVVGVKPGSRAEKAGIRPGDRLKRINDIDTSTLTIQEAHAIVIESGIHLRLAVTAPEDEEDSYFCYEDPIETGYDSEEERRLEEEKIKKRQVHAKVSSYWSLQWPWVSKRRIIYRESNCFMVPSKYEGKHSNKFPTQPMIRKEEDIVLNNINSQKEKLKQNINPSSKNEPLPENSIANAQMPLTNGVDHKTSLTNGVESIVKENGLKTLPEIPENVEESISEDISELEDTGITENSEKEEMSGQEEALEEELSELDSKTDSEIEENSQAELSEATDGHDKLINEVLENHDVSKEEEDHILDGILNENDANSSNER
ncbi:hypothetical protein MSG28_003829 [Choristoneura fumiferana]|uniref:Uncharacterized protein n=1 Tax=Choristoneura fumiferana TaxID=7141 RepID=A0ACC0KGY0_CHOFU|nr:hypothetical protein MSG28_003829 [Choristoneura fumiferana]